MNDTDSMRTTIILAFLTVTAAAHAQFTLQTSNTSADLRGIHSIGNGVAWASGTNGTVLRTEDGGYVWQGCSMPPGAEKLDFRGIQAFDANTAIVMSSGKGDLSRLYKTTDGCHSWKLIFTNPDGDGFFDAIHFDRGQWGWLLGDPVGGRFALFASDDGGRTWNRQMNTGLKADSASQGAFAASNSSIVGIYGALNFASGGKEGAFVYSLRQVQICLDNCSKEDVASAERKSLWERKDVPIGHRSEASGIFSIFERSDSATPEWWKKKVVAVGGDYLKPELSESTAAYSSDGGKSWQSAQTPPHGYRSAVAYYEASKAWITVGPNGTDVSTDDGRNWRAVHPDAALHEAPDADQKWNALSLPYVVGPHGRIGRLDEAAITAKKGAEK